MLSLITCLKTPHQTSNLFMQEFIKKFQTVVIGTIDTNNLPFSSYAPYIYDQNKFYIYISDIATHAKNLKENPNISLFFIEDESSSKNLFARKRISLQCVSKIIKRKTQRFEEVMQLYNKKFDSSMVTMLKNMTDFNLYESEVKSGEATFGFGEAYTIGGKNMDKLVPRQGSAHQHANK
jgi:heme iron utilization protein